MTCLFLSSLACWFIHTHAWGCLAKANIAIIFGSLKPSCGCHSLEASSAQQRLASSGLPVCICQLISLITHVSSFAVLQWILKVEQSGVQGDMGSTRRSQRCRQPGEDHNRERDRNLQIEHSTSNRRNSIGSNLNGNHDGAQALVPRLCYPLICVTDEQEKARLSMCCLEQKLQPRAQGKRQTHME